MVMSNKKFIDILDEQILLSRQFLYRIEEDKGSGKIKESTANVLMAAQLIVLQSSILMFETLKEVGDETQSS